MLLKSELEKLYLTDNLSPIQIARMCGLTRRDIDHELTRLDIPRKGRECWGKKGEKHVAWKGGKTLTTSGYVLVYMPEHHRARKTGYVLEHILIWEKVHNRELPSRWVIHHINGIKDDNRPVNLKAMRFNRHHSQLVNYQILQRRIRELECEMELLKKSLRDKQLIFEINKN